MEVEVLIASIETLARRLVTDLRQEIGAAAPRRTFTLAVPGGSVAETFLPHLPASGIDWRGVEIFWTDERAVAPDSPESNYAVADRLWLRHVRSAPARIHRMPAERLPAQDAVETYASSLHAAAGTPPRLDYVLLGVGEDGHVASIFPRDPALHEAPGSPVAWTNGAPKPPPCRMTLTLATLGAARRVVVAAFGEGKAQAVGEAGAGRDPASPLAAVLRLAVRPLVLVDPLAAGELSGDGLPAHFTLQREA